MLNIDGATINIAGLCKWWRSSFYFVLQLQVNLHNTIVLSDYTNAAFNNIEAPLQATFTLTDTAGNESSAITLSDVIGVRLDKVAPVVTVTPTFVRSGAAREVVVSATDYLRQSQYLLTETLEILLYEIQQQ